MAKDREDDSAAPSLAQQMASVAELIGKGVSQGINEASTKYGPIRQVPITQYHPKTPLNPQGLKEDQRPQLTRRYFQNGFAMLPDRLTDEQRVLLNKLRPGTYLDRRIDVRERYPEGGGQNIVDISYNNLTIEQRLEMKSVVKNLTDMLQQIVAEQAVAA